MGQKEYSIIDYGVVILYPKIKIRHPATHVQKRYVSLIAANLSGIFLALPVATFYMHWSPSKYIS